MAHRVIEMFLWKNITTYKSLRAFLDERWVLISKPNVTHWKYSVRSVARMDCLRSCMSSLYSFDDRLEKILWPWRAAEHIIIHTHWCVQDRSEQRVSPQLDMSIVLDSRTPKHPKSIWQKSLTLTRQARCPNEFTNSIYSKLSATFPYKAGLHIANS